MATVDEYRQVASAMRWFGVAVPALAGAVAWIATAGWIEGPARSAVDDGVGSTSHSVAPAQREGGAQSTEACRRARGCDAYRRATAATRDGDDGSLSCTPRPAPWVSAR